MARHSARAEFPPKIAKTRTEYGLRVAYVRVVAIPLNNHHLAGRIDGDIPHYYAKVRRLSVTVETNLHGLAKLGHLEVSENKACIRVPIRGRPL